MAIGSGLSSQLGFKQEATYGTYIVPTRFLEFNAESIKAEVAKMRTRQPGDRFQRASRVRTWVNGAKGDIEFDVQNKGFGTLFKAMLGASATAQVASTTEYKHTFTPDAAGMAGVFTTVQIGRPSIDGTVNPFNYLGGKIVGWEFMCELQKNLSVKTTWDFKTVETSDTLAAASLPSGSTPLSFVDGALTIGGVTTNIQKASIKGTTQLDVGRYSFGINKREPIADGEMVVEGEIDMEFESLTQYNAFIAGTQAALVLTFSYGTITGASTPYSLIITIPLIEYTGDTPVVPSSAIVRQNLPFKALWDGTNPIVSWEYHTSDTVI